VLSPTYSLTTRLRTRAARFGMAGDVIGCCCGHRMYPPPAPRLGATFGHPGARFHELEGSGGPRFPGPRSVAASWLRRAPLGNQLVIA
jgi:hypothetical protein